MGSGPKEGCMARHDHGLTLVEALLAIVLAGILAGLGAAAAARWTDRVAVETAAGDLLEAYRRARAVAGEWGRPAELLVTPDSLVLRATWHGETTEVWRAPGPARAGVALAPPRHSVTFHPAGFALGAANVSHVLTRGGARRVVTVSRLGRVRLP
jgi:type II secretory pathway pseudopilin PulG